MHPPLGVNKRLVSLELRVSETSNKTPYMGNIMVEVQRQEEQMGMKWGWEFRGGSPHEHGPDRREDPQRAMVEGKTLSPRVKGLHFILKANGRH